MFLKTFMSLTNFKQIGNSNHLIRFETGNIMPTNLSIPQLRFNKISYLYRNYKFTPHFRIVFTILWLSADKQHQFMNSSDFWIAVFKFISKTFFSRTKSTGHSNICFSLTNWLLIKSFDFRFINLQLI